MHLAGTILRRRAVMGIFGGWFMQAEALGTGGAVQLFDIQIHLAQWQAHEMRPAAVAASAHLAPLIVLAGDAAVTAHYRSASNLQPFSLSSVA
eukprot:SAG11_NODE_141_length_14934_cov_4.821503_14_plen_93_part_00